MPCEVPQRPVAEDFSMPRTVPIRDFALCALLLAATPAAADPVAGAVGYEYFRGSSAESHAALALAVVDLAVVDALAQASRWTDEAMGQGTSLTAGAGVRLAGPLRARGRATRVLGDGTAHAWLLRAGPELRFGQTASVAGYLERATVDGGGSSDGFAGEALVAVHPRLVARATTSFARGEDDNTAAQTSAGVIWRALTRLDLTAEAGWAETRGTSVTPLPAAGSSGGFLPLLRGSQTGAPASSATSTRTSSPTMLLGARVVFP